MASSAGVPNSDLADLQATTKENLPDLEFQYALDKQNYPVCNHWLRRDKVQIESGTEIKRNIILDHSGHARHVRLFQKTPIGISDVQFQISAPWTQVQTYWSLERREMLRNRAPAKFVDLMQTRRLDALMAMAEILEERAWLTPSSSTDDLNPYGLTYWLSHREDSITSATDDGDFAAYRVRYSGSGNTTTKGGIDGSLHTKWRNYAAVYDAINDDFVKRMRRAFHETNFVAPQMVADIRKGPAASFRIYMAVDELTQYEGLVTSANDNLGRDLDPFHGMTTFRRVPIINAPAIKDFTLLGGSGTSNTTDPVIGVNHACFFPYVQDGDWMREEGPYNDVEQYNTFTHFLGGSYNYFCTNVRNAGFVLHKPITA